MTGNRRGFKHWAAQKKILLFFRLQKTGFFWSKLKLTRRRIYAFFNKPYTFLLICFATEESCSGDVIANAIRSFVWNGVLCRSGSVGKSLSLSNDFEDVESIANLVERVSQFLLWRPEPRPRHGRTCWQLCAWSKTIKVRQSFPPIEECVNR